MSEDIRYAGRRTAFRTGNSLAVTIDAGVLEDEFGVHPDEIETGEFDLPTQYDADAEEYRVDLSVVRDSDQER